MTIDSEDIDAAVAAGVIPQAHADALRAFAAERRRPAPTEAGREDESFRFMTGFNDFFFAIGILLLGSGIAFFSIGGQSPWWMSMFAATVMWGLSELLVRRMRLVLPGILLSLFFIMFVFLMIPSDLFRHSAPRFPLPHPLANMLLGLTGAPAVTLTKSLIAGAAAGFYYLRFRLPFTLLPIAFCVVTAIGAASEIAFGPLPPTAGSLLGLILGIAVFAVAMSYDMSDRDRLTRRADCAFWLHLLAAPLIVHSLIALITPSLKQIDDAVAAAIILIVAALAVIAIIIDRRALLVAALIYVGVVIAYAIGGQALWSQRMTDRSLVFFATLTILGLFVICLGVGWVPLRRRLIGLISPSIAARVPPVPNRS